MKRISVRSKKRRIKKKGFLYEKGAIPFRCGIEGVEVFKFKKGERGAIGFIVQFAPQTLRLMLTLHPASILTYIESLRKHFIRTYKSRPVFIPEQKSLINTYCKNEIINTDFVCLEGKRFIERGFKIDVTETLFQLKILSELFDRIAPIDN